MKKMMKVGLGIPKVFVNAGEKTNKPISKANIDKYILNGDVNG